MENDGGSRRLPLSEYYACVEGRLSSLAQAYLSFCPTVPHTECEQIKTENSQRHFIAMNENGVVAP